MLRPAELALYDTKEIDFEEVNQINNDEDESEEASWQKKSAPNSDESSGDSGGGFRKQVDFGIDKETSAKLEKLNVMLMVGKEKDTENNNNKVDSAPTTSREPLDSPTRNYVKSVLGIRGLMMFCVFFLEPDF
jgi:hypothetical protein